MRARFQLQITLFWVLGVVPIERPLDINRMRVVTLNQIAVIAIHGSHQIGQGDDDTFSDALARTDGAMIGREAYQNPYFLAALEAALFNQTSAPRHAVIDAYLEYATQALAGGTPLHQLSRHVLGLFQGLPRLSHLSAVRLHVAGVVQTADDDGQHRKDNGENQDDAQA